MPDSHRVEILACELKRMLGERAFFSVTGEAEPPCPDAHFDEAFLKEHVDALDRPFYVCGTPEMVESVAKALQAIGVSEDAIVREAS